MKDPQVPRFQGFDERSDVFVFVTFDMNDVIEDNAVLSKGWKLPRRVRIDYKSHESLTFISVGHKGS